MKEKVFCIGFHKTATSSLCAALEYLGYRVKGYEILTSYDEVKREAERYSEDYDALRDMPWPLVYEWLDKRFEEAKFILTIRDESDWIQSVQNHFGRSAHEMHEWVYGTVDPFGDEERFLEVYRGHNASVRTYFEGREGDDFITMDITKGDGWGKLCPFLGHKKPIFSFPNTNVSENRERGMSVAEWIHWRSDQVPRKLIKHYRQGRLQRSVKEWFVSGEIRRALKVGLDKILGVDSR